LRAFGEQVNGLLTLHYEEIQPHVQAGVERAIESIGEYIIDEAARLTAETVQQSETLPQLRGWRAGHWRRRRAPPCPVGGYAVGSSGGGES
jgi:hypothetical protein